MGFTPTVKAAKKVRKLEKKGWKFQYPYGEHTIKTRESAETLIGSEGPVNHLGQHTAVPTWDKDFHEVVRDAFSKKPHRRGDHLLV